MNTMLANTAFTSFQSTVETEKIKMNKEIQYKRAIIAMTAMILVAVMNAVNGFTILALANIAAGIGNVIVLNRMGTDLTLVFMAPVPVLTKVAMIMLLGISEYLIDPFYGKTDDIYMIYLLFKYIILATTMVF